MGMGGSRTVADRQTSIQVQSAAYGAPVTVVYGTQRVAGNLVWFANFQAIPHSEKVGGKGGSATNTTYTYTGSAILSLAEGTIAGIGDVWKDKDKTTLADLGLTLFNGADGQATWSFLSGYSIPINWPYNIAIGFPTAPSFVDQAIGYSGTAYVAASNYQLSDGAQVPNHNFEVIGKLVYGGAIEDANPAAIIPDMLTAPRYGLGFNAGWVASLTEYSNYCVALGLFISPAYTQQRPGADCLQEIADATNTAILWSGGLLKMIPYGDAAITGNGATYTPNLTPAYDLADDDFIQTGSDPILVTRTTPADAYNRVQVQFRNRANSYNDEIVTVEDLDAIEKYGLKIAPVTTVEFICEAAVAKQVAQLILQRQLYKRNTYEFELNARFPMLEPMDIVTLTDPQLGMNRLAVRLTKIEEQDNSFRCTAEDLSVGVASAATYTHDSGLRWQNSTALVPANCAAPVLFEIPADQTTTGLAVGIAVGGQTTDNLYGGCRVWISLDGVNYKDEGVIVGSSRYGTTTATLPAVAAAGIDSTSTLALSLRSGGQMLSGSAADLNKKTTLIAVGGEYLSYQTATLTGTNAYNVTLLNRGLYGTTPDAKASGSTWVRVDEGTLVLSDLDPTMIGQTIYIKVCAFNLYGAAEQSLAAVSAYTYTITGNMKVLELIQGRKTIGGPLPSAAESSPGDVHVGDDGTYYERVNDGGITLGGFAVTLAGYRPQLVWTPSASQPLRDTIAQAGAAYTAANDAIDQLADLANDGVITINEKITKLIPESARLADKWTALSTIAASLGVSTTAASAARTAWLSYLSGLSPAWNDTTQDTLVTRTAYNSARDAYDLALYDLDRAIKAVAATTSTWSGVSGTGKPADNADVTSANTAANTSNVGSIPATAVSSTINSGGGVATNQVTTDSVQANNIIKTSYVAAGSTTLVPASATTVASLSVVKDRGTDSVLRIQVTAVQYIQDNATTTLQILVNGSSVYSMLHDQAGDNMAKYSESYVVFVPGLAAGTHSVTVTVILTNGSASTSSFNQTFLEVDERKR